MATVKIGNASIDENGNAHGGVAGDQTGKEVVTKNWYLHKKGWRIIRHKNIDIAYKIATAMERACANDLIGYDQYQRDTLLKAAAAVDYDPGRVTKACECDCSSLVRVCIAFAYGYDFVGKVAPNTRFSTATMCNVLLKTNDFEEIKDNTTVDSYLQRGDILVTKTQGHTVVALSNGKNHKVPEPTPEPAPEPRPVPTGECPYTMPSETVTTLRNRKGDGVKWIQWHLLKYDPSCLPKYGIDGIYGKESRDAVKAFQAEQGLKVDGKVGVLTRAELVMLGWKDYVPTDESELDPDAVDNEDEVAEYEDLYVDEDGFLALSPEEAAEVAAELARSEREGT